MKVLNEIIKETKITEAPRVNPFTPEVLNSLGEYTERNAHGEVLYYISELLREKYFKDIFMGVNLIQSAERSLSPELKIIRNKAEKQMLKFIADEYGEDVYQAVSSSL